MIRAHIGDAVIAVADDPCLESFLAFMGSAAALSRARPDEPILNLDIGGGTTNLALGRAGEVLHTGSLFIGARHVEVLPGSHRIRRLSDHAAQLFISLGITARPGDALTPAELTALLNVYITLLEAAVTGDPAPFQGPPGRSLVDAPFQLPATITAPWLTLSGGVGALVHAHLAGQPPPPLTAFGDLGVELAARIAASPVLTARLLTPASTTRATSFGLLRHLTRLSGSTLYLPRPDLLPLTDLPIFGRITATSTTDELHAALALVARSASGGCLTVVLDGPRPAAVKALGDRLAAALAALRFPPTCPLVLLVADNVGKALGGYASRFGRLPLTLIVLDEVSARGARFVQIGRMTEQMVPVSFYGLASANPEAI